MKRLLISLGALVAAAAILFYVAINTRAGQDFLMERAVTVMASVPEPPADGLRAFVCGSAAPIPTPGRAQACIAVLTPEHFFVVDAGSGSANVLGLERLPLDTLDGVLLTHFHSDHIADVPSINVQAWAQGLRGGLQVYGPPGVQEVVDGFNMAMSHDRIHRSTHHGMDFMRPEDGVLRAVEHALEDTLTFGDLTVTAFPADHSPVEPAVSYRFDYKGRSIVVTGDTVVTERLRTAVDGTDLLLSDALSIPIVQTLEKASRAMGRDRIAKIMIDIQDYHAHSEAVIELTETSDIAMTAFYHLVPGPRNRVMENIFKRGLADNMLLTHDGMWFELPVGSGDIKVIE